MQEIDEQAAYYFHKLLKITLLFSVIWNTVVFALTPVVMPFFDVAPETRSLTVCLVLIHNVFNCIAFPFADPLEKGFQATDDVKFTMVWSMLTTISMRLLFSILFAVILEMGVIGIVVAICLDCSERMGNEVIEVSGKEGRNEWCEPVSEEEYGKLK